ncbi:hypothetical protein A9975_21545 [Cupriavidus sp. UME77]|nr:hypothetical protein [Cupriavidus sp. UME77]
MSIFESESASGNPVSRLPETISTAATISSMKRRQTLIALINKDIDNAHGIVFTDIVSRHQV